MDAAPKFQKERVDRFFRKTFREKADEVMARSAVIELVRVGTITSGKGAELLGMDRWSFSDLLSEHAVPSFELLPGETMEQHLREGRDALRRKQKEGE